jgi:hypothetical protein
VSIHNNAQAMGAAAALPSETKNKARTANPETEKKENTMQTTDKQAQAAIKSDNEAQATPLNLHAMYRQQASCDFTRSLLLMPDTVESIASRLRGISAIGAVLTAATDDESLVIGEWMHGGLLDALRHLAADAHAALEHANERATNAAQKEVAHHA